MGGMAHETVFTAFAFIDIFVDFSCRITGNRGISA